MSRESEWQGLAAADERDAKIAQLEQRIKELEELVAKKFDADMMELSEEEFADFVESMREARAIYAERVLCGGEQ